MGLEVPNRPGGKSRLQMRPGPGTIYSIERIMKRNGLSRWLFKGKPFVFAAQASNLSGLGLAVLLIVLALALPARGQGITVARDGTTATTPLALPYAFYNTSFGAAAGFVYGAAGWPQKQATVLATIIGGTNSTLAFYGLARDVQAPILTDRLFLDADLALSTFGTIYSYTRGNPNYLNEQAGSNNSSDNNWIRGPGTDNIARIKFRYLLPIGDGKDHIMSTYLVNRGLLMQGAQGGKSWNPFDSGKTYLEARPFWREQEVRSRQVRQRLKTNGLELSVTRDNTDFPKNPSTGSYVRARYTVDFGYFDSSTKYDVVDLEYTKYFSLGSSEIFRQRVLAVDLATATSPSWDEYTTKNNGQRVFERPPAWAGATLGGLWRMRAYPTARFHDKASIYYSAEYRMIPEWNPFAHIDWLQKHVGIAWWQWVPFIEAGRVAPEWNISTLHSSMKWDAGFGVRALAKGIVVRIDMAVGGGGNYGVQMMVGHPFDF